MVKTASEDHFVFTNDKLYGQPFTLVQERRTGFVERYFLVMMQLNTGSCVPVIIDGNDDDHYTNP